MHEAPCIVFQAAPQLHDVLELKLYVQMNTHILITLNKHTYSYVVHVSYYSLFMLDFVSAGKMNNKVVSSSC